MWRTTLWEAWRAVSSARRATFSSTLIITLSLTILGFLGLVALALEHEAREARHWITVEIFLSDSATTADLQLTRAALIRMPEVLDAHLVTRQEAVERFREFFDPSLLNALETNPLPRSFLLTLTDEGKSPSALTRLVERLRQMPHVDAVQADIEWVRTLGRLVAGAATIVLLLLLSVGIAVSIVISRTIGLGITARIEVVDVLRTIGAPESFVRRPFAIVGLCQGAVSGLVAGGLVLLASHLLGLVPLIGGSAGGHVAQTTALLLALIGVLLGWWGSRSALATTLPPDTWVEPPERRV